MNNLRNIDRLIRVLTSEIRFFNEDLRRTTESHFLPWSIDSLRIKAPWHFCWGCCYTPCCACSSSKSRRLKQRASRRARKMRRGWA